MPFLSIHFICFFFLFLLPIFFLPSTLSCFEHFIILLHTCNDVYVYQAKIPCCNPCNDLLHDPEPKALELVPSLRRPPMTYPTVRIPRVPQHCPPNQAVNPVTRQFVVHHFFFFLNIFTPLSTLSIYEEEKYKLNMQCLITIDLLVNFRDKMDRKKTSVT